MPFTRMQEVDKAIGHRIRPDNAMQRKSASTRMIPYFPFSELYWALFHVLSNPLG